MKVPSPANLTQPYSVPPRILTNKGWNRYHTGIMPCYFHKKLCQEEFVRTIVIREISRWLGVESVSRRYSGGKVISGVSRTSWDEPDCVKDLHARRNGGTNTEDRLQEKPRQLQIT
jgi:hypothetical protein